GDGITSSEPNPTHTYTAAGTYTVTLSISGISYLSGYSLSKTSTIAVTNAYPVAAFRAYHYDVATNSFSTTGTAPFAVTFKDQSTGVISSYFWDYGDGTTSTKQSPVHLYT